MTSKKCLNSYYKFIYRVIFHLFYINNLLLLRKVLYYPNRILGHFDKFMGLIDVVHLSMCCFADCFHHFLKQNNTSLFIVLNLRSTLALHFTNTYTHRFRTTNGDSIYSNLPFFKIICSFF